MFTIRILIALAVLVTATAAADEVGETGFSQPGIYGSAWVDHALENPQHFDFLVYQARPHRPGAARVPGELRKLRQAGVRLMVDIQFYTVKEQRGVRDRPPPMFELNYYEYLFAKTLDPVSDLDIDIVTIEEENVYWGGRAEFLSDLYRRLKSRYPDQDFYQWYSPRRKPSIAIPGKTWPALPADGWVIDQYGIYGDEFADYIDSMAEIGKPLMAIVWASPRWKVGDKQREHDMRWWNRLGWRMLHSHLSVYQSHDTPVAFFMYTTSDGEPGSRAIPMSDSDDECEQNFVREFVRRTLGKIRSGEKIPSTIPKQRPDWIPGVCGE